MKIKLWRILIRQQNKGNKELHLMDPWNKKEQPYSQNRITMNSWIINIVQFEFIEIFKNPGNKFSGSFFKAFFSFWFFLTNKFKNLSHIIFNDFFIRFRSHIFVLNISRESIKDVVNFLYFSLRLFNSFTFTSKSVSTSNINIVLSFN